MSNMDAEGASRPDSLPPTGLHKLRHVNFWLRELPFSLVLVLTLIGVAYTSFSRKPITGYWEILAPLIALIPSPLTKPVIIPVSAGNVLAP